jgi:hypothetical protein
MKGLRAAHLRGMVGPGHHPGTIKPQVDLKQGLLIRSFSALVPTMSVPLSTRPSLSQSQTGRCWWNTQMRMGAPSMVMPRAHFRPRDVSVPKPPQPRLKPIRNHPNYGNKLEKMHRLKAKLEAKRHGEPYVMQNHEKADARWMRVGYNPYNGNYKRKQSKYTAGKSGRQLRKQRQTVYATRFQVRLLKKLLPERR